MANAGSGPEEMPPQGRAPVVLSRLAPVSHQTPLVAREHLLAALDQNSDSRLVLLDAPAGYGKTILLSQWRERVLAAGGLFAWVTVDEEDCGPGDVVTYLLYSAQRAGLALDPALLDSPMLNEATARHRLCELINSIIYDTRKIVIVLDEFENMTARASLAFVELFLKWAPANLQLAIATRHRPALAAANLRAQGLLFEVSADDLRLTAQEIGILFGGRLSRGDVALIERYTEGWPVAVQLLRGWWSSSGEQPDILGKLTDFTETIADYLSEQVLRGLPKETFEYLRDISVLDNISPGAIEHVFGDAGHWHGLVGKSALRPFLVSLDKDIGVYRLHPVLRDHLRRGFERDVPPDRRKAVHVAAARWYGRAGQTVRAVRHALSAGDHDLAAWLIADAGGTQIWIRHGMSRLKAVDALIDDTLLARFPRLQLLRALALVKDGALVLARRMLEQARDVTGGFQRDPAGGDLAALQLDSLVVETTIIVNECRPARDSYLRTYERTIQKISGDDHVCLGQMNNFLCLCYNQRGRFEDARRIARKAIDHYRQAALPHGVFFEHLHLGSIYFALGQPETADAEYDRAQALARRYFSDDETKSALIDSLKAEIQLERQQLESARRRIRNAEVRLRRSEFWFDIFAAEVGAAAALAYEDEGLDSALGVLDAAWAEMEERQAVGFLLFLNASRVSFMAMAGQTREARALAAAALPELADYLARDRDSLFWREQEVVLTAFSRLALADGRLEPVAAALDHVLPEFETFGNTRVLLRLRTLRAIIAWQAGEFARAGAEAGIILGLAASSGYVRIFHEERSRVLPLLKDYKKRHGKGLGQGEKGQLTSLLSALDVGARACRPTVSLTPREVQILREASLGQSDKLIARALTVSENTVKFHLKNIYAKLNARGRMEAMHLARRHGLLK